MARIGAGVDVHGHGGLGEQGEVGASIRGLRPCPTGERGVQCWRGAATASPVASFPSFCRARLWRWEGEAPSSYRPNWPTPTCATASWGARGERERDAGPREFWSNSTNLNSNLSSFLGCPPTVRHNVSTRFLFLFLKPLMTISCSLNYQVV